MKKMKLLTLILLLAFIASCSSDDSVGLNSEEPLNSKLPKKVTFEFWNSDTNEWLSDDGVYEFFYNSDNTINEIKFSEYYPFTVFHSFSYTNGYLSQMTSDYGGGISNYVFTYDNGFMITEDSPENPNNQNFVEYFYSNGKLTNSSSYYAISTYQFGSNNNLIYRTSNDTEVNSIFDRTFDYTYDNKKNPFINLSTKMKRVLYSDLFINTFTLQELFPNQNNILSEDVNILFSSNGSNFHSYSNTFIYTYDIDGYPLEKILYNSDGLSIRKTIYEYY